MSRPGGGGLQLLKMSGSAILLWGVGLSQVLTEWPPLMLGAEPLPLWGSLLEAVLAQFEMHDEEGASPRSPPNPLLRPEN